MIFIKCLFIQERDKSFKDLSKDSDYRLELLKKKNGEVTEYLDRVDKDLSLFKNYCDTMKTQPISELFNAFITDEDIKNDNEQELLNDIKKYDKIDKERKDDVINFT